ncbi:hypothetical protein I3843_15G096900 [Carya illinoinensis]|nr:hypothetical protein I3843_15G096900 [Carya illinoinensis]
MATSPSPPYYTPTITKMSKLLLHSPHFTSIHGRTLSSLLILSSPHFTLSPLPALPFHRPSSLFLSPPPSPLPSFHRRTFSVRAFDSSEEETKGKEVGPEVNKIDDGGKTFASLREDYPTGEFQFEEFSWWRKFTVKLKLLIAFPWERVRKGTVLTMKLRGQISDQLKSRFSSGLSLPQICENIVKATYDPRISGIYLHVETLSCGWGKVEEIRRHILDFKQSGVLDKIGIEPQVVRIGKYKSAGDQLTRTTMSEENCEMLTALLNNIYGDWLDKVSSVQGKTREDLENFINEGVFQVERLKEEGWITKICYDDEVISMLSERLGMQKDKNLPMVDYRKYSRVRKWTLGLSGGKDQIALIRASGSISRVRSPLSVPSSGITAEQFIEKIRSVRESKRYKAAIIRIDSPGGDALASDLMWREIRLLAASKPVIASMSDVAASGGYYMAMAAGTIVAENLTLTGSIGVVTGKFNLGNLYEKIGFNKEIISRGRYAELLAAENRPFRTLLQAFCLSMEFNSLCYYN